FLERYKDRLAADVIVLTDTANLATGVPSITYALRGIVVVEVEVTAVDHPLHSGMWGGPVPDSTMALCRLLARLVNPDGSVAVPHFYDSVAPMTDAERARMKALPFDEAAFRSDAGLFDGVRFAGERGYTVYEQIWRRPSINVSAMESSPLEGASNQIVPAARARIDVRTVPNMDGRAIGKLIEDELRRDPPFGVRVTTRTVAAGGHWMTDPSGPAFDAAARALAKGYGRPTAFIGCGGSIPFVEPFSRVLGGAPALLLGLEDPICNAHSENESLSLSDFEKALKSAAYLYDELSRLRVAR
ncbi:MAG TPA: peptidase dimerization domain-containing protein, partial [Minicystis sp.]|nr:peptidase dimerization domain-containing protein [Minicystis sp.]